MTGKKESFKYLFAKICVGLIGLVSMHLQTKYMSPSAIGNFSLITGFTGIVVALLGSWIGSAGLRYYHAYHKSGQDSSFFSTIMWDWFIVFGVMCLVAIIGSYCISSIPLFPYLSYVLFILFWASLWEIYEKIMRVSKHDNIYCVILILQAFLNIAVMVVYYKTTGQEIESLFAAKIYTLALILLIIVGVLKLWRFLKFSAYSWKMNVVFFKYGMPMVGVWGVSWLLNYSDRYIINYFLSSTQVGLYDIAYRFTESSMGMLLSSFNLAFFPAMIRTWNDIGKGAVSEMMKTIFNYFFMFAIPSCIGITLLAKQFYGTIIDIQYQEAAVVMSISCIGFVFMGINSVLYKLWQLEEKTQVVLYLTIFAVSLNIITNLIFVPLYGYITAAVTTVCSYLLTTLLTGFLIRRKFTIKLDNSQFWKQIAAGIFMGGAILLLRKYIINTGTLFMCVAFSALIYFAVLALLGGLKQEIKFIWDKFRENLS